MSALEGPLPLSYIYLDSMVGFESENHHPAPGLTSFLAVASLKWATAVSATLTLLKKSRTRLNNDTS